MNTENSKRNESNKFVNLSIYYIWKTLDFDLPDESYSVSDIQDYFEFIIKKHKTLTENPTIQIYPNKIKNRIVF